MSHDLEKDLRRLRKKKLISVRHKALERTATALKAIYEQRELMLLLDEGFVGEIDIAKRGAEEAVLHLAIIEARANDAIVEDILFAHDLEGILE